MEVQIQRLQSTVQAFDGDVPLSPQTMDKIVRAVLQAVNDQQTHAAARPRRAAHYQRREPRARGSGSKQRWNRSRRRRCCVEWFSRCRT